VAKSAAAGAAAGVGSGVSSGVAAGSTAVAGAGVAGASVGTTVGTTVGFMNSGLTAIVVLLLLFFVAFNILEANLPSLVSRFAPPEAKGAALGVFNTTQAFGLFLGGAAGGWLTKHMGTASVFVFCTVLMALWLAVCAGMGQPKARGT
jgi:MFS family permease